MLPQPTISIVSFIQNGVEHAAVGAPESILRFLKKHNIVEFTIRGSAHSEIVLVLEEGEVQSWSDYRENGSGPEPKLIQ